MKKITKHITSIINKLPISYLVIKYIFFGVLTTLCNFLCFALFKDVLQWSIFISNTLSIVISILFAYYVNANWVFEFQKKGITNIIKSLGTFISARLITMIIELVGVELLVETLDYDAMLSKLLINVIVLILNYVFSAIIFKKK